MVSYDTEVSRPAPGRRDCLRGLLGVSGTLALGALPLSTLPTSGALAAVTLAPRLPATRRLSFHSLHTDERLSATYLRDGRRDRGAMAEIDALLRDWRTAEVRPIDPRLLDQLFALKESLGSSGTFQVVSGYRSPETNAKLAALSDGVAKRSYHMRGMAIDIRLSDRKLPELHEAALALRSGGVGLYTKSDFLHLDTGGVRRWGG